jgi:hypothetical protein
MLLMIAQQAVAVPKSRFLGDKCIKNLFWTKCDLEGSECLSCLYRRNSLRHLNGWACDVEALTAFCEITKWAAKESGSNLIALEELQQSQLAQEAYRKDKAQAQKMWLRKNKNTKDTAEYSKMHAIYQRQLNKWHANGGFHSKQPRPAMNPQLKHLENKRNSQIAILATQDGRKADSDAWKQEKLFAKSHPKEMGSMQLSMAKV